MLDVLLLGQVSTLPSSESVKSYGPKRNSSSALTALVIGSLFGNELGFALRSLFHFGAGLATASRHIVDEFGWASSLVFELCGHQGGNASFIGSCARIGLGFPDEAIGGSRYLDVVAKTDVFAEQ